MQPTNFTFTPTQLQKLLTQQDELNRYIHPTWQEQGFDWYTAIVDECQEILEHLGWKWWKKDYNCGMTEDNKAQVQLEVIDILHFILSLDVVTYSRMPAGNLTEILNARMFNGEVKSLTMDMRRYAVNGVKVSFLWEMWRDLAHTVGLTTEQVLEIYAQKYALNKFRQDHGYKTGEYAKNWKISTGVADDQWELREDNYWLEKVASGSSDETAIYSSLQYLYNNRLNK